MYSLALRETGEVGLYGDAKQVAPFCFVLPGGDNKLKFCTAMLSRTL